MSQAQTQTLKKEPSPARVKLPKGYMLPKAFKGPWFSAMAPRDQRAFMVSHNAGEIKYKSASKRDAETYAENPQNNKIGR